MRDFWRTLAEGYSGSFRVELDELIDAGDCVFLAYRQSALVRGSDSRVHERLYYAVRLRDGKLADGEVYSRRGTALEAVGLQA